MSISETGLDVALMPRDPSNDSSYVALDVERDVEPTTEILPLTLSAPDLQPYTPSGWSDSIVISIVEGTNTDAGSISATDTVYADFSWANFGTDNVTTSFWVDIYIDGGYRTSYYPSGIDGMTYQYGTDVDLGTFSEGVHNIEMRVDAEYDVAESNESNNNHDRDFTVGAASGTPNLEPYLRAGWDDEIVISNVTGTTTTAATVYENDTVYVDFGCINTGDGAAGSFYYGLYIDDPAGVPLLRTPVYRSSLGAGSASYVLDAEIGPLPAGTWTFEVRCDYGSAVSESNEGDNDYSREFTITVVDDTPLIHGLPDRTLDEDGTLPVTGGGSAPMSQPQPLQFEEELQPVGFDGDLLPVGDSPETGTRYRLFDEWGGTWSDAEKDLQSGDDLLCWAGAAANMLEWTGWGLLGGMTDSDQMFQHYIDHWTDEGSLSWIAWEYWFDGTNAQAGVGGWAQIDVAGGGNFYPSLTPTDYYHTRGQGATARAEAMKDVDQYCRAGYGVALGLFGTIGHAVTCWGFNYDPALSPTDPNYYLGVWITDSDDDKYVPNGHTAPDVLHYYAVTWDSGNSRYNFDAYYPGSYIGEVDGLEPWGITTYDLHDYASDAETADSSLTFSIVGNTHPECGASIAANRYLEIDPDADWNGASDVTIQVSDGNTTSTDVFTVTVNPVNDAPTAANETCTTIEDTAYTFAPAEFNFADVDAGDTLQSVRITQLESVGDLELDGTPVTLDQVIAVADITGGKLKFEPQPDESGTGYDTFQFRVSDGTAESASAYTMTIDVTAADDPPTVTNVWVRGSSWNSSFLAELATLGVGGTDGYAIPVGSTAQLATLPWVNIDTVAIEFSEDVNVEKTDLDLRGVTVAQYGFVPTDPEGFSYDSVNHVATWKLNQEIDEPDKLLIDLSGVTDGGSNALDGEWTDSTSSYPSGNGTAGGDFQFRFNVLPGDADQSEWVLTADWRLIRSKLGKVPADAEYSIFCDVDASAWILTADWRNARSRLLDQLPSGDPPPAGGDMTSSDGYVDGLMLEPVIDSMEDSSDPWGAPAVESVWDQALMLVGDDLEGEDQDQEVELPDSLMADLMALPF